jgi:hypothetical protein
MTPDHRTLDWAVDIIGMCEPIRCHQGGMWFGSNHNFADATFVDYGAADAFAVAAKALPDLVKALKLARARIEYLGAACNDPRHFEANANTFLPAIDDVLAVVGGSRNG